MNSHIKKTVRGMPFFAQTAAICFCMAIAAILLSVKSASAATCTYSYDGASDAPINGWNTTNNWTCGHVPTSGDDVVIPAATTTYIGAQPASSAVKSITIDATGVLILGSYNMSATSSVSVSGTYTVGAGTASTTALTVAAGGVVSIASGGSVSSTSIVNAGTLTIAAGTLMSTANVTSTGAITLSTGTLSIVGNATSSGAGSITVTGAGLINLGGHFSNTGSFAPGTGTVRLSGSGSQLVSGSIFYNLTTSKSGGTAILASSSTVLGALTTETGGTLSVNTTGGLHVLGAATIGAGTTFALGAGTSTIVGTITNAGTITESTGSLIHTAESVSLTDASYAAASAYTTPATIYIEVQDSNRNLLGATAETMTVTLTTDAAAGSDSETVTLTESGLATGIFYGSIATIGTNSVSVAGNRVEVSADGVATLTYTDAQDATDTGTDTASLVYAVTVATVTDTGSGAHLGVGGYVAPTPTQQSVASGADTQALLNNLAAINVAVHKLMKLADDGKVSTQEDSAVYYIGTDGKRHAFPNARIYATWYPDFSGVSTISAANLASIPLGTNVVYKPGVRMVKFTTDPKVYAVAAKGTLRWIKTEAIATAIYGSAWNKNIDDLADTFYGNYTFGTDISSASDFNKATETSGAVNPSSEF